MSAWASLTVYGGDQLSIIYLLDHPRHCAKLALETLPFSSPSHRHLAVVNKLGSIAQALAVWVFY